MRTDFIFLFYFIFTDGLYTDNACLVKWLFSKTKAVFECTLLVMIEELALEWWEWGGGGFQSFKRTLSISFMLMVQCL